MTRMTTKQKRPLTEASDELAREMNVRLKCYDRWVAEGKMTQTEAQERFDRLATAACYLKRQLEKMTVEEQKKPLDDDIPF